MRAGGSYNGGGVGGADGDGGDDSGGGNGGGSSNGGDGGRGSGSDGGGFLPLIEYWYSKGPCHMLHLFVFPDSMTTLMRQCID